MFNHVGTTQEYLYHLCRNEVLIKSYLLEAETMVGNVDFVREDSNEPSEPEVKRCKNSQFEKCIIMHSVLHDKTR